MVGEPAAAVGAHDVDAALAGPLLPEREVAGVRAATERVDRRVLEEQQRLRLLARLHPRAELLLELDPRPVLDLAEVADPQLVGHAAKDTAPARPAGPARRPVTGM